MSQAKVDKRKYEKYHRKEIERKKKMKTLIRCIVAAFVLGAIIGVPLSVNYYKSIPKFVGDSTLKAFVANYIDEQHAEDIASLGKSEDATTEEAANSEDSVSTVKDALEEALGDDVKAVTADEVDSLNSDNSESSDEETSESEE